MKKILTVCLAFISSLGFAQTKTDTTKRLKEVVVRPYFTTQPLRRATGTVGLLDSAVFQKQQGTSLVAAANGVPGVRMEERSPGSYRLSLRGSLLRSPFGVRNIKIYIDEFPLTDAGGNSYLNALDMAGIQNIQILKGPQSSIFGANSGGVVLIQPKSVSAAETTDLSLGMQAGSFGLFKEDLTLGQQWKKYQLNISQAYQRSDGYRDHSGMERKYIQTFQKYDYAPTASLKALVFYSDLYYQTPGGLTAEQLALNPRLSRPGTEKTKSAIDQQAAIYSKTIYGGVSNDWQISPGFKHVISVFGSYTDFKNPFITNYEHRKEQTLGLRTYVEYGKKLKELNWKFDLGLESAQTGTDFDNFDNNLGTPGNVQASDKLKAVSNFAFAHLNLDFSERLLLELSASVNFYKYRYESFAPIAIAQKTNTFDTQFMPRAALSYLVDQNFSLRASVSKGYSPPTTAEVRASDNIINVDLQPELGWNYETGLKYQALNQRLFLDISGFFYHLEQAIVRRLDQNDKEYFINAGGTKQWGLESAVSFQLIPMKSAGIIRALQMRNAYTLSRFKFNDYVASNISYSGNALTGVPKNIVVSSVDVQFPKGYYLFIQHNYTSRIPLNDANSVYGNQYHLLQAKLGLKNLKLGNSNLEVFAGADNILNQKYSLGNDLNAANNRYFNAAASRNFYAGLVLRLVKH